MSTTPHFRWKEMTFQYFSSTKIYSGHLHISNAKCIISTKSTRRQTSEHWEYFSGKWQTEKAWFSLPYVHSCRCNKSNALMEGPKEWEVVRKVTWFRFKFGCGLHNVGTCNQLIQVGSETFVCCSCISLWQLSTDNRYLARSWNHQKIDFCQNAWKVMEVRLKKQNGTVMHFKKK